MGGEICKNCHRGFLLRTSKGTKRCSNCGYIQHDSLGRKTEGTIIWPKEEKKEEIPRVQSKEIRAIPRGEGYQTEEYKKRKFAHDERIRFLNKKKSIEKILRRLRKNKYSPIKEINIEGEIYDVETGKLKKLKEKKKEKFAPNREIEEMVFEESE